jgi:lipid-binding SYLF domain-containing protein
MKKYVVLLLMLWVSAISWAASAREDAVERLNKSAEVLQEIMNAPDKGIPQEVLDGAKCVAVVPNMVKGGFVFGAQHGKGVATCRLGPGRWSAPAFFTISGGSWGAQIGAEGVDLVMMIMNEAGMKNLLSSKFEIGGQASAAAGPVGRHAAAGTDWKLETQVLTYSRSKGAFAGITLNGSRIVQDDDSMKAVYGAGATQQAALTGKLKTPAAAKPFLATVARKKAAAEAKK